MTTKVPATQATNTKGKGGTQTKANSGATAKPKSVEPDVPISSPVSLLIDHITEDQAILKECDQNIEKAKGDKKKVTDRLRDYRKDAYHLYKFGTPAEQEKLKALGFDMESAQSTLNPIAQTAMDILTKAKRKMTCEELHNEYVSGVKVKEDILDYTNFNIKIRSLFHSQRLIQQKVDDGNNTRTDIVYINGFDYKK